MAEQIEEPPQEVMSKWEQQRNSYALKPLVEDLPLNADGEERDVKITCVELWNDNLYIGTSVGEILHLVLLPPEDGQDAAGQISYILASRLQPPFNASSGVTDGIKQILLLPAVSKACILCNGTLSFYSLPELTPTYRNRQMHNCTWIGGVDENIGTSEEGPGGGVVVMMCIKSRIRLIRLGEEARIVSDIQIGGCLAAIRRENYACVADTKSYSLVDVAAQQKAPLFPISSLSSPSEELDAANWPQSTSVGTPSSKGGAPGQSPAANRDGRGHDRSSSLGNFAANLRKGLESPKRGGSKGSLELPGTPQGRPGSALMAPSPERDMSPDPSHRDSKVLPDVPRPKLQPHILSPSPTEFLLTTGTALTDPGVGMFVNLDGEVVRGTLDFHTYPETIAIDGDVPDMTGSVRSIEQGQDSAVLATVRKGPDSEERVIEVHSLGADMNEAQAKSIVELSLWNDAKDENAGLGLRRVLSPSELTLDEVLDNLKLKHLDISQLIQNGSASTDNESIQKREQEEIAFVERLAKVRVNVLFWCGANIAWAARNPSMIKLNAELELAWATTSTQTSSDGNVVSDQFLRIQDKLRKSEARSELEFLSFGYLRQKIALILFTRLAKKTFEGTIAFENEKRFVEQALKEGELDPRLILAMIPILRDEIDTGSRGLWVQNGLQSIIFDYFEQLKAIQGDPDKRRPFAENILPLVKRYLMHRRQKKGFGSIPDEKAVSSSVDAALVHTLLILEREGSRNPASHRSELITVLDAGVDSFERAIVLLEQFHRLYALSHLYQYQRNAAQVLATWRRILEGERDDGNEFRDGEQRMRSYLSKIKDTKLIEQYGTWLANRNPQLGVLVFTDHEKGVKFDPTKVVALLNKQAPGAVKFYLEHLVFTKNMPRYANELIAYYLDTVVAELSQSTTSRDILMQTYETYRALQPPKPTYRQFLIENALEAEWSQNRLRLLQLLGGSHGAASRYDVGEIWERLVPYEQELVPEMIILHGRQGRQQEALRLLTHGLGDYDTAISYCLLGGVSIFRSDADIDAGTTYPSHAEQAKLFNYLLDEFLSIEDGPSCVERTSELLDRFGPWFDIFVVLKKIPESWSVELIANYITGALRRLLGQKNEMLIARALSGAENLKVNAAFIEKIEALGPTIQTTAMVPTG